MELPLDVKIKYLLSDLGDARWGVSHYTDKLKLTLQSLKKALDSLNEDSEESLLAKREFLEGTIEEYSALYRKLCSSLDIKI